MLAGVNGTSAALDAITRLKSSLLAAQREGRLDDEARLCNLIGKRYERLGRLRAALRYHRADLQISRGLKDVEGMAIANGNIGGVYLMLEVFEQAREAFDKQLEMARLIDSLIECQRAYCNMGNYYLKKSEYEPRIIALESRKEALKYFEIALDYGLRLSVISEENNAEPAGQKSSAKSFSARTASKPTMKEISTMIATTYLHIGNVHELLARPLLASASFQSALTVATAHCDHATIASCHGYMGLHRLKTHTAAEAIECFDLQLLHAKQASPAERSEGEAKAMANLGIAQMAIGDYKLALTTFYLYQDFARVNFGGGNPTRDRGRSSPKTKIGFGMREEADSMIAEALACIEARKNASELKLRLSHEKALRDPRVHFKLLEDLASAYSTLKERAGQRAALLDSMALAGELALSKTRLASLHKELGDCELELQAYPEAVCAYRTCLAEAADTISSKKKARLLVRMAEAMRKGSYDSHVTLSVLDEARTLLEKESAGSISGRNLLAECYGELAMIYSSLSNATLSAKFLGDCRSTAAVLLASHSDSRANSDNGPPKQTDDSDFSYFANRKPSKGLFKMLGADFALTKRTKKSRGLDLKISIGSSTRDAKSERMNSRRRRRSGEGHLQMDKVFSQEEDASNVAISAQEDLQTVGSPRPRPSRRIIIESCSEDEREWCENTLTQPSSGLAIPDALEEFMHANDYDYGDAFATVE